MFGIFKIEKNLFQPIKIFTLDSRILAYFLKGLTHDFGQTTALFAFRRLGKNHLKIMFRDHLTHGFGSKMAIFPTLFF